MKKSIFLTALFAVLAIGTAVAQPRAIGVNLGSGSGFSYQHNLGEANMLDVAVSIPIVNGFGIGGSVTYDWINPFGTAIPWDYKGSWNWSLGVGAAGGIYGFSAPAWYAGVAGHVGVAYDFWFPLELSFDYRPNIGVSNYYNNWFNLGGLFSGVSLGVRYLF